MSRAEKIPNYTLDAYLAMEPEGQVRHEFIDGELFAMAGSSRTHNTLVTNLVIALGSHLRATPCRVASNDMKVVIAASNRAYYPDLVVSCNDPTGEIDAYSETRPRLIVEVLSPSTANTDRRHKRLDYQMLESLEDYVLVSQTEALVEVYSRQADGWTYARYGSGETVDLPSIDLRLPMSLVYEGIVLPSNDS